MSDWIRSKALELGASEEAVAALELCANELLSNIIEHGSPGRQARVQLRLGRLGGQLGLEVRDDGPAFDPLAVDPPAPAAGLAEARIGGLGVHLTRSLMARCLYRRSAEGNILTLIADTV